jgi:acyl dehydratase
VRLHEISDFRVGQRAELRKTFTDEDVRHFIAITGDTNPLHVDDQFASRTFFQRRITHGMLTASLFSTLVGMFIPGTGAIYRTQTLEFLRPVFVGDTVTAIFEIVAIDEENRILEIDSRIVNGEGEVVVSGICTAGLIRRFEDARALR